MLTLARALGTTPAAHPGGRCRPDRSNGRPVIWVCGPMSALMMLSKVAMALADALVDARDDHLAILPMRSARLTPARFPGKPSLDLHAGSTAPRV